MHWCLCSPCLLMHYGKVADLCLQSALSLYRHDFRGRKEKILSWTQYPKLPPILAHSICISHLGGIFLCSFGRPSWFQCLTSQTRNPNFNRVPLWFPKFGGFTQTFPPLPVIACYCWRKPPPTAAKICVARALFFSTAYSAYPCRDLINSSNS